MISLFFLTLGFAIGIIFTVAISPSEETEMDVISNQEYIGFSDEISVVLINTSRIYQDDCNIGYSWNGTECINNIKFVTIGDYDYCNCKGFK